MRAMSKDSGSPFPSSSTYSEPASTWKSDNPSFLSKFSVSSGSNTQWHPKSTLEPTIQAQSDQTRSEIVGNTDTIHHSRKRRKLTAEEENLRETTAAAISISLATDQFSVLYPDVDSPFENQVNVVNRLLPYHIFQHPKLDLDIARKPKGKAKATEYDYLREEIGETKFAVDCTARLHQLRKRFKKIRLKPGKNTAPHDQAICLARAVLESDREVKSSMDQELSLLRTNLDKIVRAKKAQNNANNNRPSTSTHSFSTYPGYTSSNTAQRTPTNMTYSQYYGGYNYTYGQANAYMYHTAQYANGNQISPIATYSPSTVQPSQPNLAPAVPVATPAPTAADASTAPSPSLPVHLPTTSLPALQALGILPVPKAALPQSPQSQPAAVLVGSTNNGTMLLLEINVSKLQPTQMSGLAILLRGLVRNIGSMEMITAAALSAAASSGAQTGSVASPTTSQQQSNDVPVPNGPDKTDKENDGNKIA